MRDDFRIGVVLLNYRGARDTLACLDSLLNQQRLFDRVVICDNASPDDSWAVLRAGLQARAAALEQAAARHPQAPVLRWHATTQLALEAGQQPPPAWITLVLNRGNHGFAAGNNIGLKLLLQDPRTSHVWLLNNDTELQADALEQLCAAAAARPAVGLWGGTLLYYHHPDQVQALGGGTLRPSTCETRHLGAFLPRSAVPATGAAAAQVERDMDYALGACMFATRGWLDRVGLLSEDFFLFYEELDWSLRGKAAGLQIGYAHQAIVMHKEGASIGTAPSGGSPLAVFHLTRSRLIFCRRHFGGQRLFWVAMFAVWQAAKFVLKRQPRLARATLSGASSVFFGPRGSV